MAPAILEAFERWKNIASLAGSGFTLEGLAQALVDDEGLSAVRIQIADNHGNGVEAYNETKWYAFTVGKTANGL